MLLLYRNYYICFLVIIFNLKNEFLRARVALSADEEKEEEKKRINKK